MRVISNKRLVEFSAIHSDAESALQNWRKALEHHTPTTFNEMKVIFGSVDLVGDFHVFNIRGNHYRLIALVKYNQQICYVRHILTHKEYDKGLWK